MVRPRPIPTPYLYLWTTSHTDLQKRFFFFITFNIYSNNKWLTIYMHIDFTVRYIDKFTNEIVEFPKYLHQRANSMLYNLQYISNRRNVTYKITK